MTKLKVAINGFGRIGRITLRAMLQKPELEVVAINDLTDNKTLAHLFKYDSIHRTFQGEVTADDENIFINGKAVRAFSERNPADLPWNQLDVDVVIEATGIFRTREQAALHLAAGAKKVIISAPAKGNDPIKSIVVGINHDLLEADDLIVSNASCTTNCAAPMVKLLDDHFSISSGFVTTTHAYTGDQRIHDAPHRDLRRARAAAENLIPTTTGAANALTKIFPKLDGKLAGSAIRVPVPTGSMTDITVYVEKYVTESEINQLFKNAAEGPMKGVLAYTEDPIVSSDIITNPHSCIFDAQLTTVLGQMVKIVGWYDNEYGYSSRLADLAVMMSKMPKAVNA